MRARYNLVSLSVLTSAILLLHVCASRWLEGRFRHVTAAPSTPRPSPYTGGANGNATSSTSSTGSLAPPAQINGNTVAVTEGERRSVPRNEGWRGLYFILFTLSVSAAALVLRLALGHLGSGLWQHLSLFDVAVGALFYQFTLYVALRMAHRGLTLGELGLVCFGGTAVFMECLNITIARVCTSPPSNLTFRANEKGRTDLANHHSLHQDLPPPHTPCHLSINAHRWPLPRWLPPCANPRSFASRRADSSPAPASPNPRRGPPCPEAPRSRRGGGCSPRRFRTTRDLDTVVSRGTGSVDVGASLGVGEAKEDRAAGVLDRVGECERRGVGAAADKVEAGGGRGGCGGGWPWLWGCGRHDGRHGHERDDGRNGKGTGCGG